MSAGLFAQSADSDFETKANPDGSVTIAKYVGWDGGDIVIPAQINGKPVTAIGERAFVGSDVTSVVIPDSVTSIWGEAFSGVKLTSVTLGANIAAILQGTFGENIFYNYIANDRKAGAYTMNMKIEKKTADDFVYIETRYGLVITGYNQSARTALRIPDKINGATVKAIYGAFQKKGIARLLIPDSVTYIGYAAFSENQLTSVVIPDGVTYIGEWAFSENQLTSVVIPDGVTYIGDAAFSENQLTSVVIPDGVTYIGGWAFSENQLTSVVIPDSVTYIAERAFVKNQLTSVVIPDSVTYIGREAFGSKF